MGGENWGCLARRLRESGSSPRGRGKLACQLVDGCSAGLIPAWAGKTSSGKSADSSFAAHPRVGGENVLVGARDRLREGSSPRGRGKPSGDSQESHRVRLIPAWAGKTLIVDRPANPQAAHPRVGGENAAARSVSRVPIGSSPRGRGKP